MYELLYLSRSSCAFIMVHLKNLKSTGMWTTKMQRIRIHCFLIEVCYWTIIEHITNHTLQLVVKVLKGQGGVPGCWIMKIAFMMFIEREEWDLPNAFDPSKNIDPSQSYGWLKVSAYVNSIARAIFICVYLKILIFQL